MASSILESGRGGTDAGHGRNCILRLTEERGISLDCRLTRKISQADRASSCVLLVYSCLWLIQGVILVAAHHCRSGRIDPAVSLRIATRPVFSRHMAFLPSAIL